MAYLIQTGKFVKYNSIIYKLLGIHYFLWVSLSDAYKSVYKINYSKKSYFQKLIL